MRNRSRDETRDVGQPQETAVLGTQRAQISYTLSLSSSTSVVLPPVLGKRQRPGSDPRVLSDPGSKRTSDELTRPIDLEANIVLDLVNCACFFVDSSFGSFISREAPGRRLSIFHALPPGPDDNTQTDFHGCSKRK